MSIIKSHLKQKQSNKIDKEMTLIDAEDKLLKESIEEYIFMADRQQIFYNAEDAMDVDRPQRLRLVVEPAGCILENCWQMDTSPVRAFDIGDSTSFSWSTNMILDLFVRTRTNEVSIINMLTVLYQIFLYHYSLLEYLIKIILLHIHMGFVSYSYYYCHACWLE